MSRAIWPVPAAAGSTLCKRIAGQWSNAALHAIAAYHPAVTEATPMTGHVPVVEINANGITLSSAEPLYAAGSQRAPIPATAPGRWQQLHAAGRP
jgi:hypothetical protein